MVVKRHLRAGQEQQQGPPAGASPSTLPPCPLCGRAMVPGPSTDLHHPVPRSQGGRAAVAMHRVCHQKIHSVFTETELAQAYHDWQRLRGHPAMADFIRWIARKPPEYYDRSRATRARRARSGGPGRG
ncbi:HNH endonuclease [Cupriavidus sp. CV2]|uniref:HNH endonuclease n=1 Tax=Cupriavidus ulmosensis TaxID=3065913 RepID=UPI00296AEF26|nr:HNH endonuclease [Cupriavidus sp. CV2]MDW3687391.1 HNH endonuclease [Cupriavidus sp. CV2]